MSKQSAINGIERKYSNEDEEPSEKKLKLGGDEDDTEDGSPSGDPRVKISADEFFLGMLSKIPKGGKKKTVNSFIRTLLLLRDTFTDEEDPEDDPIIRRAISAQEINLQNLQNPIILPGNPGSSLPAVMFCLVPEMAGQILPSPLTIARSPNLLVNAFSPTTLPSSSNMAIPFTAAITLNGHMEQPNVISPAKMPALEACPQLTPATIRQTQLQGALTIPAVQPMPAQQMNSHELIRMQQIRQEKVKMAPPQTMSPMDASIQAKERALHQAALQSMNSQAVATEADVVLCESLKNKILQSIHSNHNGKASPEEINRYLKQNFFMILENNQYIYVPNPWHQKPAFVRQFMHSAAAQQTSHALGAMMLPPRPPQSAHLTPVSQMQPMQMQQIPNMLQPTVLQPHIVGLGVNQMLSAGNPVANWPSQQNVLLNTLQPNIITTPSGIQVISPPKEGLPFEATRRNDWSVKTIPLPTCPHNNCECFPMNPFPILPKRH